MISLHEETLYSILDHINDAYAPNTIRAYRADFSEWISFCMEKGACPLPADPFVFSEFLLGLADAGNNRASTIRRKCASISAIHRYGYFEDPSQTPGGQNSYSQDQPQVRHALQTGAADKQAHAG